MADNLIVHYSGDWIFYQGAVAASARLFVYDSGTLDLASIFTDNALTVASSNPVVADSAGLMPFAYKGTGDYKVILKTATATDVTIDSEDVITGALDTSTFTAASFAAPDTNCSAKTTDHTVVAGDLGTVLNCNVTSASITITLISAVTATNGRGVEIRHTGTANQVKIATVSSQTISQPATGVTTTAFALVGYGESVTLVSDGAGWHVTAYVAPLMRPNTPGIIQIVDRVSAAPGSPVAGDRYIVSAAYSTFEQEDIIEYDGTNYIEYSPPADCGWVAYVQDEDAFYVYVATAWVEDAATQAQMETGTDVARRVTPGRQHFHPGHPKCWGHVTVSGGTPTLQTSYNITSITDTGTGRLTITIATDFSSANWCCLATIGGVVQVNIDSSTHVAGSVEIQSRDNAGTLAEPTSYSFAGLGDLA